MVKYESYQQYINHQGQKLSKELPIIQKVDVEYERIVFKRYQGIDFADKSILCVGARLGGEVRAFANLGAMAVGIDVNPGKMNHYVMYGDAHEIRFPDRSFDYLFSNAVDHFLYLDKFLNEARRVADNIILELAAQKQGAYEVRDMTDLDKIVDYIFGLTLFNEIDARAIHNESDNLDWKGIRLMMS